MSVGAFGHKIHHFPGTLQSGNCFVPLLRLLSALWFGQKCEWATYIVLCMSFPEYTDVGVSCSFPYSSNVLKPCSHLTEPRETWILVDLASSTKQFLNYQRGARSQKCSPGTWIGPVWMQNKEMFLKRFLWCETIDCWVLSVEFSSIKSVY